MFAFFLKAPRARASGAQSAVSPALPLSLSGPEPWHSALVWSPKDSAESQKVARALASVSVSVSDSQTKGRRNFAHSQSLEGGAAGHARLLKLLGCEGGGLEPARIREMSRQNPYSSSPL